MAKREKQRERWQETILNVEFIYTFNQRMSQIWMIYFMNLEIY